MPGSWEAPWCRALRPAPDGSRVSPGSRQSDSGTPRRHTPWPAGRRCWRLRRWGRRSAPRETSRRGPARRPRPAPTAMTVVRVNRRDVHDAATQRSRGGLTARLRPPRAQRPGPRRTETGRRGAWSRQRRTWPSSAEGIAGSISGKRRRLVAQDRAQGVTGRGARKRPTPGEHLVQDRAEGKHISASSRPAWARTCSGAM